MNNIRVVSGLIMLAGLGIGVATCRSAEAEAVSVMHQIYAVAQAIAVFLFAYILAKAVDSIVISAMRDWKEEKRQEAQSKEDREAR